MHPRRGNAMTSDDEERPPLLLDRRRSRRGGGGGGGPVPRRPRRRRGGVALPFPRATFFLLLLLLSAPSRSSSVSGHDDGATTAVGESGGRRLPKSWKNDEPAREKAHWKDATTTAAAAAAAAEEAEAEAATLDLEMHHEEAYVGSADGAAKRESVVLPPDDAAKRESVVLPPDDGGDEGGAEATLEDVQKVLDDFEKEKKNFEKATNRGRAKEEKQAAKEEEDPRVKEEKAETLPAAPGGDHCGCDACTCCCVSQNCGCCNKCDEAAAAAHAATFGEDAISVEEEKIKEATEPVGRPDDQAGEKEVATATATAPPKEAKDAAVDENEAAKEEEEESPKAEEETQDPQDPKVEKADEKKVAYREKVLSVTTCPRDAMVCPDGTRVEPDPARRCEFPECPPSVVVATTNVKDKEPKSPKGRPTETTVAPTIMSCAGICPLLACPRHHELVHSEKSCCGSCVLTCDLTPCVSAGCQANEAPVLEEGRCCPTCKPRRTCVDRHGKEQYVAMCLEDPCAGETCPGREDAVCASDTCGGCSAAWYADSDLEERIDCSVGRCPSDLRKCSGTSPVTDVCGENVYAKRDPSTDACDFSVCPEERVDSSRTLAEFAYAAATTTTETTTRCAHLACDVPCCLGGGDPVTPEGRCCPVCPEAPMRGRELRRIDDSTAFAAEIPTMDLANPTVLTTIEILEGHIQDPASTASVVDDDGETTTYDVTTIDPASDYRPVRTLGYDCALLPTCETPVCPPGIDAVVPDGECCPTCDDVPDCSDDPCALPVCEPGEEAKVRRGDCCPTCGEVICGSMVCPKPVCGGGEIPSVPLGKCCPLCEPPEATGCVSPFTDADDDGARLVATRCASDPCEGATCEGRPEATCVVDDCGGCHALFVDGEGSPVDCNPLKGCRPGAKMCDDGTIVDRDPDDDCEWRTCDGPDAGEDDAKNDVVVVRPGCSWVRCVTAECPEDQVLRDVNECCDRCVDRFGPQDTLVHRASVVCDDDYAVCDDGVTRVRRDPSIGCDFEPCPDSLSFDCSVVPCTVNADLDVCADGSRPVVAAEGECCPSCLPPPTDGNGRRLRDAGEVHDRRRKPPVVVFEPTIVDGCDALRTQCRANPCFGATCPGNPDAVCVEVYCGEECRAVFVVGGVEVDCDEPAVAEDDGSMGRNLRG